MGSQGKATGAPPAETQAAAGKTWYRPWISPRRVRFWLLIAVLVYTLAGFFLAPWMIKRTAEESVKELGRTLSIGQVKVNPFVLSLQLLDTEFRDTDGTLLMAFDDHFVNLQLSSLFRWAWTFREIRVVNGYLQYERFGLGDNRIFRLIGSLPKPEEPPPAETEEAGMARVIVQHFHTIDGRFEIVDHLEAGEFRVEFGPINSDLRNLSTLPDQSGQQQVGVAFPGGGSINWSGSLQINPLKSEGHLTLVARQLAEVNRYVSMIAPFGFAGESGEISYDYEMAHTGPQSISATINNLKLDVAGIAISQPPTAGGEAATLLTIPAFQIEGESIRWPEQTVALKAIKIESPELNIVRHADLTLNLQKLVAAEPAAATNESATAETDLPEAHAPSAAAREWLIEMKEFTLADGTVNLTDESITPAGAIAIQGLALGMNGIDNREGTAIPTTLDFSPSGEGQVHFDGTLVLLPEVMADGALKGTSIGLPAAQPWVSQLANIQIDSGALSLDGKIKHGPQEPGSYSGSVRIDGFKLTDTLREEQLSGCEVLDINRVEFSLSENAVKTSELNVSKPYGRFAIAPDKTTNLKGLMKERAGTADAGAESSAEAAPEADLAITIDGFKIEDMALDFSDLSLPLPFRAAIRNMDGTISTLATATAEPARVALEGQVNEFGQARIVGSLNAWSPIQFTDIQMAFRNLEMDRITPYTVAFAGWEIDAGRLDLDLDYKIKEGQLQGENEIVIRELVLGDQVENPDGVSLPLKLAVALLKDSEGVIDFGLPVSGDLNDPKFRIGGVVAKAILNLLAKAVTAPFRLLGGLVGVDSEDFGTLGFAPGSSEIFPPDREKLLKLAEAMRQRPELVLEVGGVYVAEADRPALQTQQVDGLLESTISAGERGGDELSSVIRRRATEALFQAAFPETMLESVQAGFMVSGPAAEGEEPEMVLDETAYVESLRQQLIVHQPITDQDLMHLAEARADAVLTVLHGPGQSLDRSPVSPSPAGEGQGEGQGIGVNRAEVSEGQPGASGEVALELKVNVAAAPPPS